MHHKPLKLRKLVAQQMMGRCVSEMPYWTALQHYLISSRANVLVAGQSAMSRMYILAVLWGCSQFGAAMQLPLRAGGYKHNVYRFVEMPIHLARFMQLQANAK